ncbi:unnamed protein product, partial [Heterosigma akashiwo]
MGVSRLAACISPPFSSSLPWEDGEERARGYGSGEEAMLDQALERLGASPLAWGINQRDTTEVQTQNCPIFRPVIENSWHRLLASARFAVVRGLARGEGVAPAANLEMGTETTSRDRQRGEVQIGVISSRMAIEGARVAVVLEVAAKHGAKLLGFGVDRLVPFIMGSIAKVAPASYHISSYNTPRKRKSKSFSSSV